VARRLEIPRGIGTDSIRQIMRLMFSPDLMPEIHCSTFDAYLALPRAAAPVGEPVVVGFREQAQKIAVGVHALLDRAVEENTSMLIEGANLVPGMLDLSRFADRAHVSFIMTGTLDRDAYRSRFATRSAKARGRSAESTWSTSTTSSVGLSAGESERHGPVVDNVHFDTAVVSVIRSVIICPRRCQRAEGVKVPRSGMRLCCVCWRSLLGLGRSRCRRSRWSAGAGAAAQVTFVRDPVTVNYARLVKSGCGRAVALRFRFYVVEDETLNAFAIPGGAMYVNTGLMLAVDNSAELAGVLAHEMGHVTARHVAQMANRGRNTGFVANIFYLLIGILTGNPYLANAGGLAGSVAGQAYMNTYTRDAEREADGLAVETMVHAGWNPEGMVTMFETLKKETGGYNGPQFLSSHPATDERIENVQRDIAKYPGATKLKYDDGKLRSSRSLALIIGTDRELPADDEEGEADDED
jgi:hypothetical protein